MFVKKWLLGILSLSLVLVSSCAPNHDQEKEKENNLLLTYLSVLPQEGYITSTDGTKIYYTKIGTGVPVVVLHGGPGLDHNYLVEPLKATMPGHQLIFFDQRGTGFSEGNFNQINASFINKTKFLQDLDAIRTQLNLGDKINILGHSWGGLYAMLYATDATYKSHVKSLALVSSAGAHQNYYGAPATAGTFFDNLVIKAGGVGQLTGIQAKLNVVQTPVDPSKSGYAPTLIALKEYYGFLFPKYFSDYTSVPSALEGTSENFKSLNLNFTSEKTIRNGVAVATLINANLDIVTTGANNGTFNITGILNRITGPVKLVHGANDVVPIGFVINGAGATNVQPNLTGSSSVTTHTISNCGHFPFIEKPTEFAAAMSAFFQ